MFRYKYKIGCLIYTYYTGDENRASWNGKELYCNWNGAGTYWEDASQLGKLRFIR